MPLGPKGNQYIYYIDKLSNGNIIRNKGISVRYVALTSPNNQKMGNN